jgi:hypothetical protein
MLESKGVLNQERIVKTQALSYIKVPSMLLIYLQQVGVF